MWRDEAVVVDIVTACRRIQTFAQGIDKERFMSDVEKQSAVLYQIAVIGEAVARLSPGFKQREDHVPWIDIRAMRNVLVHDYLGVNLDKVWFTVLHEVPRLLAMMQPFMPPDDGRAS